MHTVHGTIRLSVEGRILTIEGQGPWNLESIDLSVDSIGDDLRALYGAPWGALVLVEGDSILVPDAEARLIEVVRDDRVKGRLATALVLGECSVPGLVTQHLQEVYTAAGDVFQAFSNADDARRWLNAQIKAAGQTHLQ
ncbi:hypothetical protein [Aliamphritea spongicola]|uniref:hypothetical protein n=1 Tax=Aliamphritea spongicola TaxID=707589 RepID=UPI00196B7870|nr:hypothetical protein [Aliamphritea spongicola]MBN3564796.1 hypothetical protein [Aliamphritea spongicola]